MKMRRCLVLTWDLTRTRPDWSKRARSSALACGSAVGYSILKGLILGITAENIIIPGDVWQPDRVSRDKVKSDWLL